MTPGGHRPWGARAALLVAVVVAGCSSTALPSVPGTGRPQGGVPSSTVPTSPDRPPSDASLTSFVALTPGPGGATRVERYDLATGRALGAVATLPSSGPQPTWSLVSADGWLWATATSGPRLRSSVAGGDPAPDSCSGTVARVDPATGRTSVVLRTPDSVSLLGAVPSPDGRDLATVEGGCATGYLNDHVVVRDLASGRSWQIGATAVACHDLGAPAWNPAGTQLAFGWGPSTLPTGSRYVPRGICQAPAPDELALVPALRPGAVLPAELTAAPRGCGFGEPVFDTGGIALVETCGELDTLGTAAVVQLDGHLHVVRRLALAPVADGVSTQASPAGGLVLIDEYQAPPRGPRQVVDVFDGATVRQVASYPDDAVVDAAW